jgi:DNA-binding Xre family transcriptional regulator
MKTFSKRGLRGPRIEALERRYQEPIEDTLRHLYYDQQLTLAQIAERLEVDGDAGYQPARSCPARGEGILGMKALVDAETFDRTLAERGLSVTKFCRVFGVSSATVAKIHRNEPIDIRVIERMGNQLSLIAPRPEIRALMARSARDGAVSIQDKHGRALAS